MAESKSPVDLDRPTTAGSDRTVASRDPDTLLIPGEYERRPAAGGGTDLRDQQRGHNDADRDTKK